MGRSHKSVPDGDKRWGGMWRFGTAMQADAGAGIRQVGWERLAKDEQTEINGRRLIPSVYDWKDGRVFAIGGRNDLDECTDVWALYPDKTGADCSNLDPFGHFDTPAVPTFSSLACKCGCPQSGGRSAQRGRQGLGPNCAAASDPTSTPITVPSV